MEPKEIKQENRDQFRALFVCIAAAFATGSRLIVDTHSNEAINDSQRTVQAAEGVADELIARGFVEALSDLFESR
jgi:O-methyltransferase involved in polyketide biosynthesis